MINKWLTHGLKLCCWLPGTKRHLRNSQRYVFWPYGYSYSRYVTSIHHHSSTLESISFSKTVTSYVGAV